ncbi:hypothetical protein ACFOEE_04715 [Pseudoalteromonas fenneropenaei]|uniref:Carboxypeptidase regulatory-like domain-containing protein n=1 Tax=Pseudoalteromonas fenneropenaei TaxID=1737459 RepID=A0ABV7CGW2_9GAMM
MPNAIAALAKKYRQLNSPAHSPNITHSIPIDEELILAVELNGNWLSDIYAIKSAEQAQIGLVGLVNVLALPIQVDLNKVTADGWLYDEDNTLAVKMIEGELLLYRAGQLVAKTTQFTLADDLYVEAYWLQTWLDIALNLDFAGQLIKVNPTTPLPISEHLVRKNQRLATSGSAPRAQLPQQDNDYAFMSNPVFDLQLAALQQKHHHSTTYSLLGRQELGYLDSRFFLYGNDKDWLDTARVSVQRQLDESNLLRQLGVNEWQLGDIQPAQSGKSFSNQQGRGFKLFNNDADNYQHQDLVNIGGDIQPNWDVELYLNEILVARETSTNNGRFEFHNIRLRYGQNRIKLLKYGPYGEIATEHRTLYFDGKSADAWQSQFNVSLLQPGNNLLGKDFESSQDWYLSGNYQLSLPYSLQSYFGFSKLWGEAEQAQSAQFAAGLQGNLLHQAAWQLNYEHSETQRWLNGHIQTAIGGQNLSVELGQRRFDDKPKHNLLDVSLSGRLFANIYYEQKASRQENDDMSTTKLINQLSTRVRNVQVNHNFTWQQSNSSNSLAALTERYGSLFMTGFFTDFFATLNAQYDTSQTFAWRIIELSVNHQLTDELQSQWTLRHRAIDDLNQLALDLSWAQPEFTLTGGLTYDQEQHTGISLLARTSLGFANQQNKTTWSNTPLASSGGLLVRVFVDANSNLRYDLGETLLPDVKVISRQSFRTARTAADGVALLKSLTPNKRTDIEIDLATLPDPFMLRADKGFSVAPRAGQLNFVEIPITLGGEIDGTLYLAETGKPAAYVEVELVDQLGSIVATTKSEHDGYYLFTEIKPGHYLVRIAKQNQQSWVGLDLAELKFSARGELYTGVDLSLRHEERLHGYMAVIHTFHDLQLLKLYWQLIKKRLNGTFTGFYHTTPESQFQLAVSFTQTAAESQLQCDLLLAEQLNCSVETVKLSY